MNNQSLLSLIITGAILGGISGLVAYIRAKRDKALPANVLEERNKGIEARKVMTQKIVISILAAMIILFVVGKLRG